MAQIIISVGLPGLVNGKISKIVSGLRSDNDLTAQVNELNAQILKDLKSSWEDNQLFHYPAQQKGRFFKAWMKAHYLKRVKAICAKLFDSGENYAFDDPNFNILLPCWLPHLEAAGFKVRLLHSISPSPIAAGCLHHERGVKFDDGLRIWARTHLAIAAHVGKHVLTLDCQALPKDVEEKLVSFLKPNKLEAKIIADAFASEGGGTPPNYHVPRYFKLHRTPPIEKLWEHLQKGEYAAISGKLYDRFKEMFFFAGLFRHFSIADQVHIKYLQMKQPKMDLSAQNARVIHYHLFKNAGTSLDACLKENFGAEWQEEEFKPSNVLNAKSVQKWMEENPANSVLSSHTAKGVVPTVEGTLVLPLIFMRHPLDRLWSAYRFEQNQPVAARDTSSGAFLANKYNFPDYVNYRVYERKDRTCRNFQTHRFAAFVNDPMLSEFERAKEAVQNYLPFVGLVDQYSASMQRLEALMQKWWPDFEAKVVKKNVSNLSSQSLEEKIAKLSVEFGADFYDSLVELNADDLVLYKIVQDQYKVS